MCPHSIRTASSIVSPGCILKERYCTHGDGPRLSDGRVDGQRG
jgi:hypothetical protein